MLEGTCVCFFCFFFFFFQAEDGIRDKLVTGVQTCALPILTVLRLVTKQAYARTLALPSPMRDARVLRTLVMLDLESHPPGAAIDEVIIDVDVAPGRILQTGLFEPALPAPEALSTLVARLGAVAGSSRVGAPALVDTHQPGAFAMKPFAPHQAPGSRLQ